MSKYFFCKPELAYNCRDAITDDWPYIYFQAEADLEIMAWSSELEADWRELLCCMEAQGY